MDKASLIVDILTFIATTAIGVIVYVSSQRSYTAQTRTDLLTAINDFNSLALTNDACLKAVTTVLNGTEPANLDEARKTWALYSLLNNRQLHYFAAMTNHTSKEYLAADAKLLRSILANQGARDVLMSGGYDPEFVKHCLVAISDDATAPGA